MKIIRIVFSIFLIILFLFFLAGVIYFIYLYKSIEFTAEKIIYYNPSQSALFFDRNNNLLDVRFSKENRIYVKFKDIPAKVIETLIATEDTSFFEHKGINFNAIIRALIKDIKAGKKVEGASTITQQLVRNVYLNRKKTIERKLKEMIIAMKIEHILSKEEILERYLNQIYFGHGYYGIKTASLGYFHKNLKDLTLKEIAMLIALPKGPSLYDPTKNYELNIKRANRILKRMYMLKWITLSEYKKALLETPKVYKKMLTKEAPYAVDAAIKLLKKRYKDLLYRGYYVYLTIDLPTQKLASKAIRWNYKRIQKDLNSSTLNGALITINQQTGEVLALVGGVDFKKSQFNRVIQSKRSIGSAIKPFIYQIALNLGYNPSTLIPDINKIFKNPNKKIWKPKNYEKNILGLIPLKEALIHSRNLATINLALQIGIENIVKGLKEFGFKNFKRNLSIVIGSLSDSLWDLAERYTAISNYGIETKVHIVSKLFIPKENKEIIFKIQKRYIQPPYQAYLMIDILKDVVKKGTGKNAQVKGIEVAGKTGTTNKFKDAWFVGFTPNTQTIIWFGNDDNSPLKRGMSGGAISAPVFRYFYKKLLLIHPELIRNFKIPKGVFKIKIDNKEIIYTKLSPPPHSKLVPVF